MSRISRAKRRANSGPHILMVNVANSSPEVLRQAASNRQIRHIEIFADFSETKLTDERALWEPWSDLDLTLIEDMTHLESFVFIVDAYTLGKWKLDFSPLARHSSLEKIETRGFIEDADLSPLRECKELRKLSIEMLNSKSDISFLSDIPHLSALDLQFDAESRFDFSPVGECKQLTDITLSCRDHVDASALSECPKLEKLHIGPIRSVRESGWPVSVWPQWGGRRHTHGATLPSNESLRVLDLSENYLAYPYWLHSDARKKIKESEQLDISQLQGCSRLEQINLQMNGLVLVDVEPITHIQRKDSDPLPIIDLSHNYLIAVNAGGYSSFPDRIIVDEGVKRVNDNAAVSFQYGLAFWNGQTQYPINEDFIYWLEQKWEK